MKCKCKESPKVEYLNELDDSFKVNLEKIDTGFWVELFECKICGQLWKIDVWNKYQYQFAIKIDDHDKWESFDLTEDKKRLLLKARGGLTNEACIVKDCNKKCVKGVVYCIDHLYNTGVRK